MPRSVRRAVAFAVVGTVALAALEAGELAAVPFALIAVVGRLVSSGPLFRWLSSPADARVGHLRGLVSFSLAATGLALLASLTGLPETAFVAAVLLLVYGALAEAVVARRGDAPVRRIAAFVGGGSTAALVGLEAAAVAIGTSIEGATVAFLAVTGALLAALLREILVDPEDPLVLVSVTGLLWLLGSLGLSVGPLGLATALAVAVGFGYLSWLLGTASLSGMLTGMVASLATIVLGGYGWFAILITFFALGGLAAQYKYDVKLERGVAESNQGARGIRNVLGNASVAVVGVLGFAASGGLGVEPLLFSYLFAGSLSAAMSDTLSSEIGVLFGPPRLITTFERVDVGTDGGVTLGGVLAGLAGGLVVGLLAHALLETTPTGVVVIVLAGIIGMFVDSVLGATLEGWIIDNQTVNFLATLAGGLVAAVGAVAVGAFPA